MILTGELWTYLVDMNEQAQERSDTIMEQLKAAEGVTEAVSYTHLDVYKRQAIRRATIRPVVHVSSVNDELLSAVEIGRAHV